MQLSDFELTKRVKEITLSSIDNPNFSIDHLCQSLNISRSQLHRKIKRQTGFSTTIFIRKVKLQEAKKLLNTTSKNVSEIAYSVGINSPQNFSKYFQQEFGISPSKYRKNLDLVKQESVAHRNDQGLRIPTIHKKMMIPLFLVLTMLFFLFVYQNQEGTKSSQPFSTNKSIAVLPFINLSTTHSSFIHQAITEDIINHLSAIEDIKTISSTSSSRYQNSDKSMAEIGHELNVRYILEGSLQEEKEAIKINARLIDTEIDSPVWTRVFEKKYSDLFRLQSEIAKDITITLGEKISALNKTRWNVDPTQSIDAYRLVAEARKLIKKRTEKNLLEAVDKCKEAIQIDQKYGDAYALLATTNYLLLELKYKENQLTSSTVEADALNALKYDEGNPQAYVVLANLYSDQFQWKQAQISYEIALESQPNNAIFNYWYSLLLRSKGNIEDALKYNLKAKILDPFHPVIHAGYAATCIYGDKFEEALSTINKDSTLYDGSFFYYWLKGELYASTGQYMEAFNYFDQAHLLNPKMKSILMGKVYCQGKLGNEQIVLDFMEELDETNPIDLHRKAIGYASLNSIDQAESYFLKAASEGFIASDFMVDQTYRPFLERPKILAMLKDNNFIE